MNDEELKEFGWYKNAPKQGFNSRKAKASTYKSLKKNAQKDVGINAQHIKGSNSWAISGKHTKSRKAILANDPHLSNGIPSFWHASKIEYEDGTYVVGSATPGIPAHGSFSTDKISVGITTVHVDNSDIYEEEIRGDSYLFKGKLLPLETREEVIKIKGKQPIKYQVKSTHHGPLLDDYALALSNLRTSLPPELPKGNFSLAWIGLDPHEDTSFHTFLNILKANDVFEITELLVGVKRKETKTKKEDIIVPKGFTQNIMYADHKGNIGYTMSGSLVKRKNRGFGTHISKGSTGENEWIGTIPPNQRPYIINPKKGYLVAANGPTSSLNINSQAVTYMGLQPRATRIDQLVSELVQKKSGKITANDMMEVMKDTKDIVAEKNVKYLIKMSEKYIKTLKDKSLEHKIVLEIIKKLKTWQGNFGVDSVEPSYYAVWTRRVMKNFLPEEMIIDETFKIDILNKANSRLTLFRDILNNSTKEEKYCTRYENKTVSSCGELFYLSLRDTAKEFTQKGKLREIQWGQIHRAMYSYGPFSKSEMLQKLGFGTRYTSVGGSEDTVHVHCFDLSDPFFNSGRSANSKLVVDHGEGTYLSIDTGISENIFSGHNFDLNERHTNTDLILMKSLKEVMASADKEADIKINA
ncbi:unnamed protein product [Moneuplotes crassus]|uniref:Uncharacterized protein n=1 Tax=Euplotes crassus TaxID=5936 RepID=A0AAD1Y3S3_EUPCR|nr:unnamed protein product [Moneuplotes crassus]